MTSKKVNMPDEEILEMMFDPNTIKHLGMQMYSTLPPVIAELVANSYDADAQDVKIFLNDKGEKEIRIEDDGTGMTFKELNKKYLLIGRNRRETENGQYSESKKRRVIGKKGIGKLSFFGIAKVIEVVTVRNKLKNIFRMVLEDIEQAGKAGENYKPEIIKKNVPCTEDNGTTHILKNLKRKSNFNPDNIAYNLARNFSVFDELDFNVSVIYNDIPEPTPVKNEMKYENIDVEYRWTFPIDTDKLKANGYEYAKEITGEIIAASKDTVPTKMKGIALFSRGKLVNDHEFYGVNASSHGYSYLTGFLNVNFIDDWTEDVISTNRRSLNWEDDDTSKLKEYLKFVIHYIYNKHRKIREKNKKKEIKEKTGVDVDIWINDLPKHERKLANLLVSQIMNHRGIDAEESGNLVEYVKDSFQFESFKELASEIAEMEELHEDNFIKLLKEWELIEAREFYKISLVRVKAIETFEKYIDENAKEVPTVHNFLKKFPWLLDPRIMEFDDEVYFSKLLKEKFPDTDEKLESNRRIDFLCTDVSEHRFIIELKRPQHKIRYKDIDQAKEYRIFVEGLSGTDDTLSNKRIIAYIIVGNKRDVNDKTKNEMKLNYNAGDIYVKTYTDLLLQAKRYHAEFIDKYESMNKNISI